MMSRVELRPRQRKQMPKRRDKGTRVEIEPFQYGSKFGWSSVLLGRCQEEEEKKKDSVRGAATCRISMWVRLEVDDQER